MAAMTEVICQNRRCKKAFRARVADVNRGWGKFCSKSCKAKKQGRPRNKGGKCRDYPDWQRQEDEHQAILDDLGETADDRWGDSGITEY